jgi:hypothetical protein
MRRPRLPALVVAGTLAWLMIPPAAQAAGPVRVTTSGSWSVLASSLNDPLSEPAAPDPSATTNLPPAGCPRTRPGSSVGGTGGGEGILSVTMAAPGTDWGSDTDTSVAVDLRVDGGPVQQVVLFDGARPFRYQGFVGAVTGGQHCVTLTVRPDLSHTATVAPAVEVFDVALGVVPSGSADYLVETHAPVLYGRSTSAIGDTPLVTYGQASPDRDGTDTDLSYTVIWTHEDVGDGIVAGYEWGLWGRMTDIETVLNEKVAPDGRILAATYLSCGCEGAPVYPDVVPEDPAQGGETDKPYPAAGAAPGLDRHLALRDATGNNDVSPFGTSSYRFQQTLVTAPVAGQAREVAMDQNPWTYRISNGEISRETVQSTDPDNFLAGQYPQYLIVDIDSNPSGTGSVAVEVQLDGGAWYSNDYEQMTTPGPPSTFPFYNGGHGRTVIKLPPAWHSSKITGLRLRLEAAQPGTTPELGSPPTIELIEVTTDYAVVQRAVPGPVVTTSVQLVPSSLGH